MPEITLTWDELLERPFTIHTVNSHTSTLLAQTKDYFEMSDGAFYRMMRSAHAQLDDALRTSGVKYDALGPGLTPRASRREVAFLFDSQLATVSYSYGVEIADAWIPALPRSRDLLVSSILTGDILHGTYDEVLDALRTNLVPQRIFTLNSPAQIYCVYITNLSDTQYQNLDKTLSAFPPYLGHSDCSTGNSLKDLLGMSLAPLALRVGNRVLMAEGGDSANAIGFPFKEHDYEVVGVQDHLFDSMLTYRIETMRSKRILIDGALSLNTLSGRMAPVHTMELDLSEQRMQYLYNESTGHGQSFKKAGLSGFDRPTIVGKIREKLQRSYIYNLRSIAGTRQVDGQKIPWPDNDALMFSVRIEFPNSTGINVPYTVGLKYAPSSHRGEIATFFG